MRRRDGIIEAPFRIGELAANLGSPQIVKCYGRIIPYTLCIDKVIEDLPIECLLMDKIFMCVFH